ncbi:MAG: CvpA family protein [Burkholderiales bacterium]|nr:CvpA family protein [Burkholderiales bacterium]
MTLFDYAIAAILAASIAVSVWRGLIREILSLFAWVVAFVVANAFAGDLAPSLTMLPGHPVLRLIVAFLLILVACAIGMALINWLLLRAIRASGMTLADRGLGGLFGLARGLLIVLSLVIVGGMTKAPEMPFWKDALFSPLAQTAVETLRPWLPETIGSRVKF